MFLQAIGKCETVNQVQAVVKQYHESELGKEDAWLKIKGFGSIGVWTPFYPQFESQTTVGRAAATKIKRINTKDTLEVCNALDDFEDDDFYAGLMAKTLKEIAGIEVDMTKILDAKQKGLGAWNVLLSMLVAYGVKADTVLEVK